MMDSFSPVPKKPQLGCLWSVGSGTPRWGHVGRGRGAGKAALAGIPWALWWQIQPYPEPASLFPSPCSCFGSSSNPAASLGCHFLSCPQLPTAATAPPRSSPGTGSHEVTNSFLKHPRAWKRSVKWMCHGVVPSGSQAGEGCSHRPSPSKHVPSPERGGGE